MLDIQNLERRWLRYKIKSYAPHMIIILLILSLIATYYWLNSENSKATLTKEKLISSPENNASAHKHNDEESSEILEPSMNFVQSFQTSVPATQASVTVLPKSDQPLREIIPVPKVLNMPDSPPLKVVPAAIPSSADKSFSLNRNESKLDIESIERRFKETSNSNLGLFISRYHYDHANYSEAYNFALKTNTINNKIDESWIIFSKSLVKLGKVEQAKKTLQLYIGESNSESARSLLDSIEQGTFK